MWVGGWGVAFDWIALVDLSRVLRRFSFYSLSSRSAGGGGAGQAAKDANGNEIKKAAWLKTHLPGDHTLSQGLKVSE